VIYEADSCPDLVLNKGPQPRLLYWNPPLFAAKESADETPLDKLVPDLEPYLLSARAFSHLLESPGQFPLTAEELREAPLAFHVWQTRDNQMEFLVGNLERTAQGDSDVGKTLALAGPAMEVSSATGGYVLKELAGEGRVQAQKNGQGWNAEIPVAPNTSMVWIFEEQGKRSSPRRSQSSQR